MIGPLGAVLTSDWCSAGLRCLYPRLAAANHSCVANSVYAWDEADNSIVLRATRWEVVFVTTPWSACLCPGGSRGARR